MESSESLSSLLGELLGSGFFFVFFFRFEPGEQTPRMEQLQRKYEPQEQQKGSF